jgi:ABC-2 type transport system permease protein
MNIVRAFKVMRKDLRLGPRSPIFLWAILFPFLITLVIQVVFGSLFSPKPRLGIVDRGNSRVTARAAELAGIELTLLDSVPDLKRRVRDNDLDAGLFLKAGFDQAVRRGHKPLLEFWIGGESLASTRIILAVTTLDLLRGLEEDVSPVDVQIITLGDHEGLSITARLIPFMVLFALLVAGLFVPAFGLVEERENRTLNAVLVTPIRFSEVLTAKACVGWIFGVLMALVTLFLNKALGPHILALVLALFIAGLMAVEFGLIYGMISKNTKTLFTLVKTFNWYLIVPVIFYIFPEWPQWIAKMFPTYWLVNPIFEIALKEGTLTDVTFDLMVALGIIALLILPIVILSKKVQSQLAVS